MLISGNKKELTHTSAKTNVGENHLTYKMRHVNWNDLTWLTARKSRQTFPSLRT